ncbi:hypothetical protein HMPREF2533_04638 [Bacteroides fragilis]|nr:hypothetical protein HMPREF2533_04638 [Bacteroides fragilis]KXU40080.1 hypothetical protein HMPREF2530_04638 [Bacteroides fragilis]
MHIIRLFIHKYIVLETTDKQISPKRYKARRSPNWQYYQEMTVFSTTILIYLIKNRY